MNYTRMSVGIIKPKLSIQNDGTEKMKRKKKTHTHTKKKNKLCNQLAGAKNKKE